MLAQYQVFKIYFFFQVLLLACKINYFCPLNKSVQIMASNNDYGRKGAIFGKIILTIILFIILLIWIYQKNFHFLSN